LVCLDTDILVGLLKGDAEAIASLRGLLTMGETMKTNMITAYELLKGAAVSSRPEENLIQVRELLSNLPLLTLTYGSCEVASSIHREMRDRGHVIGEFDVLIAAMAISNDETLISRDKHFRLVENLRIQVW